MARSKDDRLERLVQDATAALGRLSKLLPEIVSEAVQRGGDDVRRRILDAASQQSPTTAWTPQTIQARDRVGGIRGSVTPALVEALDHAGTRGLNESALFHEVARRVPDVKPNSFKMAIKRRAEAGQLLEIDGIFFLAEHADKAAGREESEGDQGSFESPSRDADLWSGKDAAA
jgi:hypothetical protein